MPEWQMEMTFGGRIERAKLYTEKALSQNQKRNVRSLSIDSWLSNEPPTPHQPPLC